jgi:hypothetical protein
MQLHWLSQRVRERVMVTLGAALLVVAVTLAAEALAG